MASEWPVVSLGEVVNLKRGYDLASREREPGDVPIISSSGKSGSHSKAMAKAPGVVTGRYGTIGLVHYVETPFWPLNTTLYVQDFKGNDPRFVYYLLKTVSYRDYLDKAAVPGINRNDVHRAKVCLPPVAEQKSIANTLVCLDKRIELIRRESNSLESVARAIFKSWFVDFDPVRAKSEGREPGGIDAETAALFPYEFADGNAQLIPSGWRSLPLKELCKIGSGKRPGQRKDSRSEGFTVPLFGGAGIMGFVREGLTEQATLLTGRVGTLGLVFIARPPFWASDNALMVLPHHHVDLYFTYFGMRELALKNLNRGSTQPLLTQTDLGNQRVCYPSDSIALKFHEIASVLFDKIEENRGLAETLTDLRDTLLPRLISGKLRVPGAEKLLEVLL
jgi:type I restriction enzyme, S subunit